MTPTGGALKVDSVLVWAVSTCVKRGQTLDLRVASNDADAEYFLTGWSCASSDENPIEQAGIDQPTMLPLIVDWSPTSRVTGLALRIDTADWPTGLFSISVHVEQLTADGRRVAHPNAARCTIGVRAEKPGPNSVALVVPTFTIQAYNALGGSNFYHPNPRDEPGVRALDATRPILLAREAKSPYHSFVPAIRFEHELRALGLEPAPVDSMWVHHQPLEQLSAYKQILVTAHDEYLSREQRENLAAYVEGGGNLTIFCGNFCWWKIRVDDDRQISVCKVADDPEYDGADRRGIWVRRGVGTDPSEDFGLTFRHGGYPLSRYIEPDGLDEYDLSEPEYTNSSGMRVYDEAHPIFENTSLANEDYFGVDDVIVDVEIDGIEIDEHGAPVNDNRTLAPPSIEVLATATLIRLLGGRQLVRPATIVELPRGAGRVLHMGSCGWYRAATVESPAGDILRNAIRYQMSAVSRTRRAKYAMRADETEKTIVVGGASRSGTTLTTAIFDSHPQVAMAFEAVPKGFDQELPFYIDLAEGAIDEAGVEAVSVHAPQKQYSKVQRSLNLTERWFGNWVRLCRRSGVGLVDVVDVMKQLVDEGVVRIDDVDSRVRAARKIAAKKQQIADKPFMGVKSAAYLPFVDHFPNVYHVVIMRDPRDALASWRRLEWRERTATEHATRWCALFEKYRAKVPADHLVPIRYPDWAGGDQDYAKGVFEQLGLSTDFDTRTYHETTMVKGISGVNITQEDQWTEPLAAKIGYYKDILSTEDVAIIEDLAGDLMREFGFLD